MDKGLLLCLQLTDEMQNSLLNFNFRKPVSHLYDVCVRAKSLQSYSTLCDPMDCSPPGSFVHGIFLARMLEWVAISSSRGSS